MSPGAKSFAPVFTQVSKILKPKPITKPKPFTAQQSLTNMIVQKISTSDAQKSIQDIKLLSDNAQSSANKAINSAKNVVTYFNYIRNSSLTTKQGFIDHYTTVTNPTFNYNNAVTNANNAVTNANNAVTSINNIARRIPQTNNDATNNINDATAAKINASDAATVASTIEKNMLVIYNIIKSEEQKASEAAAIQESIRNAQIKQNNQNSANNYATDAKKSNIEAQKSLTTTEDYLTNANNALTRVNSINTNYSSPALSRNISNAKDWAANALQYTKFTRIFANVVNDSSKEASSAASKIDVPLARAHAERAASHAPATGAGANSVKASSGYATQYADRADTEIEALKQAAIAKAKRIADAILATNNITTKFLSNTYNNSETSSFAPTDALFGVSSKMNSNCVRNFGAVYQCGPTTMDTINSSSGKMVTFDCSKYKKKNCQFYLLLNDNGTMGLYKGVEPNEGSNRSAIWSVGTSNTQLEPNSNWVASKGKLGRNFLKMTETLANNEWIGSLNGTIRLIMQTDGNLVLQTSTTAPSCIKADNKYGTADVNAIYQVNEYSDTNKSIINKLSFIDADSNLREYPGSMIESSNDYISYSSYESPGNDIVTINANNMQECVDACNSSTQPCYGFVYNDNTNTCSLKGGSTKSIIDSKQMSIDKNVVLGLRSPRVKSNLVSTCNKNISNIDTIKYQKYMKGTNMNENVGCSTTSELISDFNEVNIVTDVLSKVYSTAVDKINNLGNTLGTNEKQVNQNNKQITSDKQKYTDNREQISKILNGFQNLNLNSNNKIEKEGMTNLSQYLNKEDIAQMLNDSDIRILQANYSYILWSVLAVGLLSVTVNTINKN
jgi:hypothetical protein